MIKYAVRNKIPASLFLPFKAVWRGFHEVDKCRILILLIANAIVLCWLEPTSEEDPGTSLGRLALGNVTLHSSCTCHEQGFHITKWNIIKIALMCSLVFLLFFFFLKFYSGLKSFSFLYCHCLASFHTFFLIFFVVVEIGPIV